MPIDNQLFLARVRIVSQNNKYFNITRAKVLSCLMLMLFYFLVVIIYYFLSNSSSVMVAKSSNSCIDLCNYIITVCINNASFLATQGLIKFGDTGINPRPKKLSAIKFCRWNVNGLLVTL